MDPNFKLDQETHDQVYAEIELEAFNLTCAVEQPRVIVTGGQPGSGKSTLIENSKKDFPNSNVVVINGDEYRRYHPRKEEMLAIDDKRFAEFTDADCRVWTKKLFDTAIDSGRNIIFETTMREAGPISETLHRLKELGYHITARVIACHARYSITGIFRRYEEQKNSAFYGRWSNLESHDAGYKGVPVTVMHIENSKLVNRFEVYDRLGQLLYSNELVSDAWQKRPAAVEAIESERARIPTSIEKRAYQIDWERILLLMNNRRASEDELLFALKIAKEWQP